MNSCSLRHCLQNGVGMLGLDWTKTTISVITCLRRNVFSKVFNTSYQTEKRLGELLRHMFEAQGVYLVNSVIEHVL